MTSRFSTGLSNFHLVGMVSSLIFSLNLLTEKPQKSMVKSLICCLFMLRKFSTQSGLTDLQHASLEDKVWFDCREFT